MADKTTTNLTETATIVGADLLYMVDGGNSRKITFTNIIAGLYSVAGSSGTGAIVRVTSATLVTPTLGVASATSINKVTLTAPASGSTLTIADGKTLTASNSITLAGTDGKTLTVSNSGTLAGGDAFVLAIAAGKTLTVSNSITLAGTDATVMTFPGANDTVAGIAAAQTLTNKTLTSATNVLGGVTMTLGSDANGDVYTRAAGVLSRIAIGTASFALGSTGSAPAWTLPTKLSAIGTTASSAAPTPSADAHTQYNVTALAEAATFGAPTGTPVNGQRLTIRIKDNGTSRALSWNAAYRAGATALPTATVISETLYLGFIWNAADSVWDFVATIDGF